MGRLVDPVELFRAFYYSLGVPLHSVIEYKNTEERRFAL